MAIFLPGLFRMRRALGLAVFTTKRNMYCAVRLLITWALGYPSIGVPLRDRLTYLWLVGNGGMVVIVVIIVPLSSIPYYPKVS